MSAPTIRAILLKEFNDFFNSLKTGGIIHVGIIQYGTDLAKHLIAA